MSLVQALVSQNAGAPLAWAELPDVPLRPDDVRVEVHAVGVNPVDWKMREASLLGLAQRVVGPGGPFVCGVDFSGVVGAVGSRVTGVAVGDRVVGGTDFSRRQRGSYARTVQVRADQVALLPPEVAFDAAACLPVAGVTARMALFELGHLLERKAPRVLVLGASGGVGHFAVQLARAYGARVAGVCSAKNASLVARLGAEPIDYGAGDALEAAAAHGPFDVIIDGIGTATYPLGRCCKLLAPDGTHVLVMPKPRDYAHIALPGRVRTVLGRPNRARLAPLVADLAAGKIEVVIAERIPLAEAERAHTVSKAGRVVGKLVLVA